ncbi:MAG: hypothetical protein RR490_05210, partial [Niameybacter sp.]
GIPTLNCASEQLKAVVSLSTYETYMIFDHGYEPSILRFGSVQGTEMSPRNELFDQVASVMNGEMTAAQWAARMEEVSDAVRDYVVK